MSGMTWNGYFRRREDDETLQCVERAAASGYKASEADDCNDGDLGCEGCPFDFPEDDDE